MGDAPLRGSELGVLMRLAWPVVIAQLGLVTMGVVDLVVVGSLGEVPLAAVGLGNTWSFAGMVVGLGAASGLDPFIAQAYGRNQPKQAGQAAITGSIVLLGVAVLLALQHLLAGPALVALGQPAAAIPDAVAYSRISIVGILPLLGFSVVRQLLQGGGIMRPAMVVILWGNVANLIADVTLVWVFEGGVAGCAWASAIVRWLMFFALIVRGADVLRAARPDVIVVSTAELVRVANKALPVGFQVGFEVWAFNAATLLAGTLGTTAAAAHTTALSAASLAFMIPLGVGQAAATRVGNLQGAGQPWQRAAFTAIGVGAGVMAFSGAIFWTLPQLVGRIYTQDPSVVALVVTVLPIAAAFGLFDGVQAVAMGILRGLGDTRWPAVIALVAHWGVGLPVGWFTMASLGLPGVWVGLSAGLGVASVLLVAGVSLHAWSSDPSAPGTASGS